jgi:hypothetical protein
MRKQQPAVVKGKAARPAKAAVPRKAAAPAKKATAAKKAAAAKRVAAAPIAAASAAADSDLIVGPYGDLMSKQELALIAATRTRVS